MQGWLGSGGWCSGAYPPHTPPACTSRRELCVDGPSASLSDVFSKFPKPLHHPTLATRIHHRRSPDATQVCHFKRPKHTHSTMHTFHTLTIPILHSVESTHAHHGGERRRHELGNDGARCRPGEDLDLSRRIGNDVLQGRVARLLTQLDDLWSGGVGCSRNG